MDKKKLYNNEPIDYKKLLLENSETAHILQIPQPKYQNKIIEEEPPVKWEDRKVVPMVPPIMLDLMYHIKNGDYKRHGFNSFRLKPRYE